MAFGDVLTPNAKLSLIKPTRLNWADTANGNFQLLDAIIGTYFTVNNLTGPWLNSTIYTIGQAIVDVVGSSIWVAATNHTSSGPPTTFAQERTTHPERWTAFSTAAHSRGAWSGPGTNYAVNDFVVSGSQYAVCIASHTSSAAFATDVALGRWSILVDLSAAGSLVLPILGGAPDANKFVVTNAAGLAYVVTTAMLALANGGASSLGLSILQAASVAAIDVILGLGTVVSFNVGGGALNIVQLDALARLPAIDGRALTNLPGSQSTTTFLGVNVALNNIANFFDGPNTGVIGAAGQTWEIKVTGNVSNAVSGSNVEVAIFDGTSYIIDVVGRMPDTLGPVAVTTQLVVVLTGPTTFTLRAKSNDVNSILLTTGTATGVNNKSTSITAVRLA